MAVSDVILPLCFCIDGCDFYSSSDVPEGFYISSLNESDVDKVDDSWPYSDKNSKMFISWLIRNYTTTAIRTADSYLVAHAIC